MPPIVIGSVGATDLGRCSTRPFFYGLSFGLLRRLCVAASSSVLFLAPLCPLDNLAVQAGERAPLTLRGRARARLVDHPVLRILVRHSRQPSLPRRARHQSGGYVLVFRASRKESRRERVNDK